ncbi:uncharacterized protein LOC120337624 [Styela clava]|uniref:uncharacterized protein LOC120337624 isoform X1 n=1 Tax=Styela clava TaxID=7725 RepID=UPI00193A1F15|nr:uncharacterized protein LOC120337624 isoform X1 [Styela clava]XP_039261418.1 uncharacterized protein LOC120337624 isoform X2 [Styela clava]
MPRFICARFQVDGRIVVIHECWLVGEGHCRWPQSGNIEELVKMGQKPKSEWGVWEIDILGGDEDYDTCSRRAYSTQQSWGSHSKVPNSVPQGPGSMTTMSSGYTYRPLLDLEKSTTSTTSSSTTSNSRKRKAPSDSEIKITLKRLEHSISTINRNLSGRLRDIEDKLKPILNDSSSNNGARSPPPASPPYVPKYDRETGRHCHTVLPPANTMEELDEWLDNQDCYAVAKRVTCTELRATVRAFMRAAMTKNLAKTFSWSGLGMRRMKTKTSFKDHKAFNYLIDVLHETPFRHASQSEISDGIKKVLAGVGEWDGGRAARYSSFPTIAFFP